MAKQFKYYDNWKTEILTCSRCNWSGTFEQGWVDYHEALADSRCPKCSDHPMLAIVSYPTHEETEANFDELSADEKESHARRKQFLGEVERTSLKTPDELPDLTGAEITLLWDFWKDDDGTDWTVIRHNDRVVWSERAVYEGAERFVEVVGILKQRYGKRLVDLVPTPVSGTYLYGDRSSSGEMVKRARSEVRG